MRGLLWHISRKVIEIKELIIQELRWIYILEEFRKKIGKPTIKSIDQNKQSEDGPIILYEEEARQMYRKWDNIKHIKEIVKSNARSRKVYVLVCGA